MLALMITNSIDTFKTTTLSQCTHLLFSCKHLEFPHNYLCIYFWVKFLIVNWH